MTVWSKEKAWEWYDSRPWLRGCNFMGSDCANRIDQWQELGFEERLKTADEELALAAATGFNTIRIILEFIVWNEQHDGFMERFDRYLDTAWKHGISCMVVFGNDCMPPKNEFWKPLKLGEQHFDWGYHGGRKHSQHSQFNAMGYHLLDEPELAERHYEWVREIIETHKDDPRIVMWDLYNEPGNSHRGPVTMKHLKKFFEIAREIDPVQPLTCAYWQTSDPEAPVSELEQFALDHSDIISYHNYGSYVNNIRLIKKLKTLGRPIINTEWLGRCLHNTVQEMFPLFYLEKIGCYNWGFVAGKYQTYEPWNGTWQAYEADPSIDVDFTKWFHDLYRPNHHPYDPKEIELIRRFAAMADDDHKNGICR
ncbi:MAG: cellulase family glycosylhydrolase [Oscillospiraceae bacterium]|nr:cellulase family glycosylhydrolase [Oscillospiraceae bacterium]